MAQVAEVPISLQKNVFPHSSLFRKVPSTAPPHNPHTHGTRCHFMLFSTKKGGHIFLQECRMMRRRPLTLGLTNLHARIFPNPNPTWNAVSWNRGGRQEGGRGPQGLNLQAHTRAPLGHLLRGQCSPGSPRHL